MLYQYLEIFYSFPKMNHIIYQVDAFTEEAFKGNPAGVMILNEDISEQRMQNIAKEMNLSETAFVNISQMPFKIRYFTPTTEVPLCGHATLASAHVLYDEGMIDSNEQIIFESKYGLLNVDNDSEGIKMIFPKYQIEEIEEVENFKYLIGFKPLKLYSSDNNWKIAVAAEEQDVVNAKPNFAAMTENGLGQLMITSITNRENVDFVVRCFAPVAGINEDPVTGSAQCGLVPLWNLITGKTTFNVVQVSERTGYLRVALVNNQVEIIGKAVTVFKATLGV